MNILLKKVKVHNLKSVDLKLKPGELVVFTGVSGSGKSSLAFDTLYVEGQRRYIESLSAHARRQLGEMEKPDLEHASGVTPTISIEQKSAGKNPRSTVGTMTEIYDYLRVLYARVATPYCPVSGEPVSPQSKERIIREVQSLPPKTRLYVFAPYAREKKAEFVEDFQDLLRKGFTRARIDGSLADLDSAVALDGSVPHDVDILVDRIQVEIQNYSRIAESVISAINLSGGLCLTVDAETEEEKLYSTHAYSPKSGLSYKSLEPHDFSFNSPAGMCETCHGLGQINDFDLDKIIDKNKSIAEDCCSVASSYNTVRYGNIYDNLARLYGFDIHSPWKKLSEEAKHVFLYGTEKKWTRMQFVHPETGARWSDHVRWRGVLYEAKARFAEAKSERYRKRMQELMHIQTCPACHGARLKPYPAAALLQKKKISDLTAMTIGECLIFFKELRLSEKEQLIAEELLKEITERLSFLEQVGLHYLTLNRTAPTLSGGEAQRVRLASQIGCGLVGITYVLDEPSIGLHPRDNKKLIETLMRLRDMGNTVCVVEHDEETIWAADRIVDVGPGPADAGGEIVVNGSLKQLLKNKRSVTGAYLSGRKSIPIPEKRRKPKKEKILIKGAAHNNLKNIDVAIPLNLFTCVTGVSGSGKSSLISDTLYPALANKLHRAEHETGKHRTIAGGQYLDKIIAIDQSPIGRNPRSNPATYIKVFDDIRDLFTQLPESKARGYQKGQFSFNVSEGSCAQCLGMGMIRIDMDFMEDAFAVCSLCHGKRFDPETLSVYFKGKNIHDILEMSVSEAAEHFSKIPSIRKKLETLQKVGMGYIKLGQPSTTLSGGEAQRIKLARELVRPSTGNTLYILDEPTTGLHFDDIRHLLLVFNELVERGNSVIVIEHNIDVVKAADWVIDLGPEGGAGGGEIVAEGTPEEIAKIKSPTGAALKEALLSNPAKKSEEAIEREKEPKHKEREVKAITVEAAEQHNLKHLNVSVPRGKITVCTGPSGSGKSSLAFDTVYAEGQRRYIESLSPYARQFVKQMPKPKVGHVEGLSPAIAIEQKTHAGNPRSTVGTMTEIYDYLRLLYAHAGIPHCPETGEVIKAVSKELVADRILSWQEGEKVQILAPIAIGKNEKFKDLLSKLQRQGFVRIRLNKEYYELDEDPDALPYDPKRKNELLLVIDRIVVGPGIGGRLLEAIDSASRYGDKKIIAAREGKDVPFNLSFAVESTGKSYPEITPHTFAFNVAEGMCLDCQGLGYQYGANLAHNPDVMSHSLMALMHQLWGSFYSDEGFMMLESFTEDEDIDPFIPLLNLPPKKLQMIFNGSSEEKWYQTEEGLEFRWAGINQVLAKAGKSAFKELRDAVVPLLDEHVCFSCGGSRLNPLARNVTIKGMPINGLCAMPVGKALHFIEKLAFSKKQEKLLEEVMKQLKGRLQFLEEAGIGYISLDRKAPTLSGGETQRIRLARQLGSGLTGVLYVLDEPTIGLHPHDIDRLNKTLRRLKDLGNTLLMVEHDPLAIKEADEILDFGPMSGEKGGHITASGTLKQIMKNPSSLTGAYLSGRKSILPPKKRREGNGSFLSIKKASLHNLKNISLEIPCGALTCITGVSGSGKSTLLEQLIAPGVRKGIALGDSVEIKGAEISGIDAFEQVVSIDQNPVGQTVRANVGTYVDALTPLRTFFASLPQARALGLQGKHFSFNHRSGMCTSCWGLGYKRVEMHFLPSVKVVCEECKGLRLNPVSLEVSYAGKNFGEYLDMTIDESRKIFENHPRVTRILDTLIAVGLGYLKLGQEVSALSGGEAQRIKLSRYLSKRSHGKTLYLLDEPTTGLHFDDIQKLLGVLQKLVAKGNTMIVIEHNIDVIKNCDKVIDLGPGAGEHGGRLIFSGTPEGLAQCKDSLTGKYLL